jgi:hypothetical protein
MFTPGGWNPLKPFDLKAERIPADEEWTSTCVVRRVRGVARQSYALEDVENKETHTLYLTWRMEHCRFELWGLDLKRETHSLYSIGATHSLLEAVAILPRLV